jgi:SPP1 family predicted phage head-tail adaptor
MIRAGELRHQVEILVRTSAQDSSGQPLDTWTVFATRMASLRRAPGREVFASAERNGRVPVVFDLRFLDGVTPAMRVRFNGKVHNIQSAFDPDGRRAELVITAEELVEVTA